MYRAGTGDFFILKFKAGGKVTFKMMVDCGCINASKDTFTPFVKDLAAFTDAEIDLLVVTHEHADHINGFEKAASEFANIHFKRVWFAWTEDDSDKLANSLRATNTKVKMALALGVQKLNGLRGRLGSRESFVDTVNMLNDLNINNTLNAAGTTPTMEDILRKNGVITDKTAVEFLRPGELKTGLEGATGLRFFVLGPPRDEKMLSIKERKGETYEKREEASSLELSFLSALTETGVGGDAAQLPFDESYVLGATQPSDIRNRYQETDNAWRQIDHDWLFQTGELALRFERSINNTSLALAIQFEQSERVLLFPGDAEFGNWLSWHDQEWSWREGKETRKVNAEYLLNNTVFYKVGHHLSQNGSAKGKGMDLMTHEDLVAMAPLDIDEEAPKISSVWLSTMPSDLLGEDLIKRTKGQIFFIGNCENILRNILTDRVSLKEADLKRLRALNKKFNGKAYVECEVQG